ncbi:hypothetical protein [Dickeya oryzae]
MLDLIDRVEAVECFVSGSGSTLTQIDGVLVALVQFDASHFDESDMALASVHHTAIRHRLGLVEAYPPEPLTTVVPTWLG